LQHEEARNSSAEGKPLTAKVVIANLTSEQFYSTWLDVETTWRAIFLISGPKYNGKINNDAIYTYMWDQARKALPWLMVSLES